jgi:hypothetical protein
MKRREKGQTEKMANIYWLSRKIEKKRMTIAQKFCYLK